MKASDVIYSFNIRNSRKDNIYPKWNIFQPYFSKITRLSDFVIEIKLKRPFAPFLTSLSDPVSYIVKNGSLKKSGFIPVGTGPFKFGRWEKGKYIVLLKNNRYWKSEVKIKKVIFKVVRTPEIAINLLKSNQAHVIELKSIELRQQFTGLTGFRIKMSQPGGIFFMIFNTKKKYLNNKNFRKSFSHLINKKVLIKSIFQNLAHAAVTPIPPGFPSFNRDIGDYKYSIARASKLIKLSGVKKGFKCRISYLQNDKTEYRIAETFRKQAEKIGVKLIKDPLPFNKLLIRLQKGDFDIALRGWVAGPDPDIYLFSNFSKVSGNSNHGKYFNTQLIDILTRARETMDKNSRINLYRKAQEIIHSEVPWIPLYYSRSSILSSEKIRNIYINANFFIIFRDAYIIN